VNWWAITNGGTNCFHLVTDALEQPRAVATSNIEPPVGAEDSAFVALLDSTGVSLRVDDMDAARCHDQMVDVSATPRNPTIVQYPHRFRCQRVETLAHAPFAFGPLRPGDQVLWLVAHLQNQATKVRVSFANAAFVIGLTTFVLALRGTTGAWR
jgi:hypothetical protein